MYFYFLKVSISSTFKVQIFLRTSFCVHVTQEKLPKQCSYKKKFACKILMKLTTGHVFEFPFFVTYQYCSKSHYQTVQSLCGITLLDYFWFEIISYPFWARENRILMANKKNVATTINTFSAYLLRARTVTYIRNILLSIGENLSVLLWDIKCFRLNKEMEF